MSHFSVDNAGFADVTFKWTTHEGTSDEATLRFDLDLFGYKLDIVRKQVGADDDIGLYGEVKNLIAEMIESVGKEIPLDCISFRMVTKFLNNVKEALGVLKKKEESQGQTDSSSSETT